MMWFVAYVWQRNKGPTRRVLFLSICFEYLGLDHLKNIGDTMAAIMQACSASGEICGTPSPKLIEQLKGSPVQVYTPFQPK